MVVLWLGYKVKEKNINHLNWIEKKIKRERKEISNDCFKEGDIKKRRQYLNFHINWLYKIIYINGMLSRHVMG